MATPTRARFGTECNSRADRQPGTKYNVPIQEPVLAKAGERDPSSDGNADADQKPGRPERGPPETVRQKLKCRVAPSKNPYE